jgi:tetratricopeptide (TPR) repeat protein
MGQYDKAGGYYLECKEIREKTLGKEHPHYASTLCNLGSFYESMGNYDNAEQCFLESKMVQEKALGKDHPDYAVTLNNLGLLYESMGNYDSAEQCFLESKMVQEKALGVEHPYCAISLCNLGRLYYYMGQYGKAEPLIDAAMRVTHQNLRQSVQFLSEKDLGKYLDKESAALQHLPSYLHAGNFPISMAALTYDDALFQKGFLQTAARRLNTLTITSLEADSLARLLSSYRKRLSAEYTKPIVKR